MSTTAFVESCVQQAAGSALAAAKLTRGKPRATKLIKCLADKKRILITTHAHPDPDALAASSAMLYLLRAKRRDATVHFSVKGQIGGGINDAFTRYAKLDLEPWDDSKLATYDAIILLDTQPTFAYSPLPPNLPATAVIDHHPARGRKPQCPFCDIRSNVGATSSIIYSYFMELGVPIPPDLGATLLYAIESDLAGAAGMPTDLDNMALSSLTLLADMHRLYQMRYVDLPQNYYVSYAAGLSSAVYFDNVMLAHIDAIDSLEKPAVIADFLLRFDKVIWCLVSGVQGNRLILSLRTSDTKHAAGEIMRRLVNKIGEGGGHRSKAGGFVPLENGSPTEIERVRQTLKRRLLRSLGIKMSRGQRLVPAKE
jgi:nanoRNase/pAp phosphatase (c-di-AMP/oligoRNAs hydrolase)